MLTDLSLWSLILSNSTTIFLATKEHWSLTTIMWIYWCQSVIIGIFNFIRILQLKEFSTIGFKINNQPAQPTETTKFFTAFFFLFHYGFFHFIYLIFLLARTFTGSLQKGNSFVDAKFIFFSASLFLIHHLFSYIYNRQSDTKKQNIGTLMFYPYARIIPMHLTIVLGFQFSENAMPFFLLLKTFADVVMHIVEHKVLRRGEEQDTPTQKV